MRVFFGYLSWLFIFPWAFFPKTEELRVGNEQGFADIHVLVRDVKIQSKDARNYHWLRGNRIIISESGYSGRLLHGNYTSFHDNGQLHEQGRIKRGLKVGEWRKWNEAGDLIAVSNWSKGLLHGIQSTIDPVLKIKKNKHYRNGQVYNPDKKKRSKSPNTPPKTEKKNSKKLKKKEKSSK